MVQSSEEDAYSESSSGSVGRGRAGRTTSSDLLGRDMRENNTEQTLQREGGGGGRW